MGANELRLGNIVQQSGNIYVVNKDILLRFLDGSGKQEYQPVLLTEGWLKRAGFQLEDVVRFGGRQDHLWILGELQFKPENGYFLLNGFEKCRIQYVHLLQNLVFALTGEELKIITPT